jgi:hypothetical protein
MSQHVGPDEDSNGCEDSFKDRALRTGRFIGFSLVASSSFLLGPLIRRVSRYVVPAIYAHTHARTYAGIQIVDAPPVYADRRFANVTCEALALVRRYDPRRFRMIQKHVRFIVHRRLPYALASYNAHLSACAVDFQRLNFTLEKRQERPREYDRQLVLYAATIIHEATHGRVEAHGIRYTGPFRLRIEEICTNEERRFLSRLPGKYQVAEDDLPVFDPETWNAIFRQTIYQRFIASWRLAKAVWESPS